MRLPEKVRAKCGPRKSKSNGMPGAFPFFFSGAGPCNIDQTFLLREVAQSPDAIEHGQIISVNGYAEAVVNVCHGRIE